jgi:hypothetical protein
MGLIRSTVRPGTSHRRLAVLGVLSVLAFLAQLVLAAPAAAAPLTGGFSPRIIANLADLNGDGLRNGRDDANEFYGSTSIIDGSLDCDAWGPIANQGDAGDLTINTNDDCKLVGYDGTPDGVTISVVNGQFQVADGPLPTVFNAAQPNNPDISASDFAWSAINGRVDSNGDEAITWEDCHFGLIGRANDVGILPDPTEGVDILGKRRDKSMWLWDAAQHGRQRSRGPQQRHGYYGRRLVFGMLLRPRRRDGRGGGPGVPRLRG